MDPSRTYSSAQLSGRIDSLVRQAGLVTNADIRSVDTDEGEIFNDHNVEVRLDRIEIDKLIRFNNLVASDLYLKLVSTRINAGNNPSLLDVRYEINALELKPEAIQN